jgi:aryl-alcohol dehydrogenase-like predicted oxidoreductase
MQTVELGNTGVEVSALCLGAMYFGTRQGQETSFRLLDQYVEAGGSFIDTANIYAHWTPGGGGGESERMLGRWMRARGNRDQLFLASKVGFGYGEIERGLSAARIQEECEKSLERLGVESIDLYYAHVDDRKTALEETLGAFSRLIAAGKVRFIGASNYLTWRLERARCVSRIHDLPRYQCIQQRYSYLRPKPGASFDPQLAVDDELLDYVRAEPVTLLAYSVLLSGAYTRAEREFPEQYRGPDSEARLQALREVAEESGATPNQVILAWMRQRGIIPLIAASTRSQLQENLESLEVTLGEEQLKRLNKAGA